MSSTTKKKHVCREVLDEYVLPSGNQEIVRVMGGRGNNLHEVVNANGKSFLVSMPTKFRKSVWIKRGDFVIVEPIEEGDKVQAEIIVILYRDQVRYIKGENMWPSAFESSDGVEKSPSPFPNASLTSSIAVSERQSSSSPDPILDDGKKQTSGGVPTDMLPPSDSEDEDYDSDEEFQVVNPNRPQAPVYESSSEEEEESDDEEEEKEEEGDEVENDKEECSLGEGLGDSMRRCTVISTQG